MPKVATYPTYCPIARALDVLGDRWTLLILRELANGDHRYTDLRTNLPGIPPNLLSQRLKALVDEGLVTTRQLPPPAARSVYTATDYGRTTIPVLRALARFGLQRIEPADEDTEIRPIAAVSSSLKPFWDRDRAGDLDQSYEVVVDGEPFLLHSAPGGRRDGVVGAAEARLELPAWVLVDLRLGTLSFDDAVTRGVLTTSGDPVAVANFRHIFHVE